MPEDKIKSAPGSTNSGDRSGFYSKLLSGSSLGGKSLPAAGMGVYITLLAISIISLLINNYVGYQPTISLLISIILGFAFYLSVHYTPEPKLKILLVLLAAGIDIILSQGLLALLPDWATKDALIFIHVFIWVILAIILFFIGLFDALGSGQTVSKPAWIVAIFIFAVILMLGFPVLLQNPLLYQRQTHSEYYSIAKEQVSSAGGELKKVGYTWGDYLGCTWSVIGNPSLNHATCLKEAEITRSCAAQFEDISEQEQCIQDQRSGKKSVQGIADTSRGATKFEFLVDEKYFQAESFLEGGLPRYQVNLEYTNARQQQIPVTFSCLFRGRTGEEDVKGLVTSQQSTTVRDKQGKIRIVCEPERPIQGKYELIVRAESTITTRTDLVRFFLGRKTDEEREEQVSIIEELEKKPIDYFSNSVPDPDPAWLSFGIGNIATDPLIVGDAPLEMSLAVENKGKGELVSIISYSLEEDDFVIPCARSDTPLVIPEKKRKAQIIPLKGCEVQSYPPELENPLDYELRSFHMSMTYNYAFIFMRQVEIMAEAGR